MIKRNQLRQFLAVIECGNFTRAAERLGVTQPTLSSAIAELERIVGTRLFIRERRLVRLTDAGNRLASHARAIEREFRAAEASYGDPQGIVAPLRLGVLHSFATQMLCGVLESLESEQPLTLTEGSDAELRRKMAEGRLDAIITLLRGEDLEGPSLRLFEEGYHLMMPEKHRLAGRTVIDAQEVASETMIARRSCEILAETSRWFTQRGIRPPFFLRSTNDDRCMEMVRIGMGVTTAPESLVRNGIVSVRLKDYDFRRTIGLISARDCEFMLDPAHPLVHACRQKVA